MHNNKEIEKVEKENFLSKEENLELTDKDVIIYEGLRVKIKINNKPSEENLKIFANTFNDLVFRKEVK